MIVRVVSRLGLSAAFLVSASFAIPASASGFAPPRRLPRARFESIIRAAYRKADASQDNHGLGLSRYMAANWRGNDQNGVPITLASEASNERAAAATGLVTKSTTVVSAVRFTSDQALVQRHTTIDSRFADKLGGTHRLISWTEDTDSWLESAKGVRLTKTRLSATGLSMDGRALFTIPSVERLARMRKYFLGRYTAANRRSLQTGRPSFELLSPGWYSTDPQGRTMRRSDVVRAPAKPKGTLRRWTVIQSVLPSGPGYRVTRASYRRVPPGTPGKRPSIVHVDEVEYWKKFGSQWLIWRTEYLRVTTS